MLCGKRSSTRRKTVNKTKIEWCDYTWNPVSGCMHGCEYCYAADIAKRFDGKKGGGEAVHVLDKPVKKDGKDLPYPYGFEPTLFRYRLNEPARKKKAARIFVCSMGDLFGEWVPDEWIEEVTTACEAAPQHTYMFLTKNPARYIWQVKIPRNHWIGTTVTGVGDIHKAKILMSFNIPGKKFLSIEPIQEELGFAKRHIFSNSIRHHWIDWVIIGAETGNRKDKVIPKREWIEDIVDICRENNVPVFMKDNLKDIWEAELIREMPRL